MTAQQLPATTLTGTYVELRPFDASHADGLVAAYEPGTMDLMSRTADVLEPLDHEHALRYLQEAIDGWHAGEYLPFTVVDRAAGDVLGATRYGSIDLDVPRVEIGWTWYSPRVRGTVVNPECKLLLLRHAFEQLGCRVVHLKTSSFNEHSQAAIAKLGATRDGVLRRDRFQRDGRLRDTVIFSILDEDWPRVRDGLERRVADQGGTWAADRS